MMHELMNAARRQAEAVGRSLAKTRIGLVRSYDPNVHAVKVELQPDGALTGWLPVKTMWAGNGWGVFAPPSVGDMVEVDFQEGDGQVPSVGLRFFNDQDRPLSVQSGEFWLVHKDGGSLKFTAGGVVTINAPGGLNIVGNTAITGTLTNNGKNVGSTHTHGGVSPGGGTSGAPT